MGSPLATQTGYFYSRNMTPCYQNSGKKPRRIIDFDL
jgi:hypothetical protein